MPDLFDKIREELRKNPLKRFFTVYGNNVLSRGRTHEIENLEDKMVVLANNGIVKDMTHNRFNKYLLSENVVSYLNNNRG